MRSARVNSRAFWSLLSASALSNLGDGMRLAAFPALAHVLTDDTVLVAGLAFAMRLPWLIFGLHAGVIADRFDRRRLMVVVGSMRAGALIALALAVLMEGLNIPLLYAVAFIVGIAEVTFDTSAQAIVPSLVDRRDLETANARIVVAEIVGNEFAGPGLGGALFAVAVAAPFLVNAGLAAASVAFLLAIQGSYKPGQNGMRAQMVTQPSMISDIIGGLKWLAKHPVLRTVTVLGGTMSFFDSAAYAILVLYAAEILGLEAVGYGLLVTMAGVGGIIGSFVSGRLARRTRTRNLMMAGVSATMLSQLGLAFASAPVTAGLLWAVAGCGYGLWGVMSMSLRQRLVPDHMLGRVGSAHRLASLGAAPLGALGGGVIAAGFGLRAPFLVGGVVLLVALVFALRHLSSEEIARATDRADAAAESEGQES